MGNYATGHALSLRELFSNFPVSKLKMTPEECKKIYSDGNKKDLAAAIFAESVELVVADIIDNNTHFKLPGVSGNEAYLYINRIEGRDFKRAFKNGKWNDVDFIMSNFSGYQLVYDVINVKKLPKRKSIYLSPKYKEKITENTNLGKQY